MSGVQDVIVAPLREGTLDEEGVRDLFGDIESLGDCVEVTVKGGAELRMTEGMQPLAGALEALLSGSVMGVQLRYVLDGEGWWDTVLKDGDAFRVVRIQAPKLP